MQTWVHYNHCTSDQVQYVIHSHYQGYIYHILHSLIYEKGGYLEAIDTCAKLSMMRTVKVLPEYAEVCILGHALPLLVHNYHNLSTVGHYR